MLGSDAPVVIEIVIEGTTLGANSDVHSVIVTQSVHTYHEFEIKLRNNLSTLEKPYFNSHKKYLQKNVVIRGGYGQTSTDNSMSFNGIITEVMMFADATTGPIAILKGYGLPYQLATGPITQVFTELSVSDIVTKCTKAEGMKTNVSSISDTLPYCVQYRETMWDFLRRLAYSYGAWLYYDGQNMHFTQAPGAGAPEVELTYGVNMLSVQSAKQAVASKVKQYDYLSVDDEYNEEQAGTNDSLFYSTSSLALPGRQRASTKQDVAQFTKNQSNSLAAQSRSLAGTIQGTKLTIGSSVKFASTSEKVGAFLVVEVRHVFEDGNWLTHFQAVSAAVKAMPVGGPPVHYPVSEAQVGTVTKNNDPRNLGRVKVELQWMEGKETSWIRVLAPHYGPGKGEKSRGFMFVPEVGDQVMVGFQHGNPDRPFVFGAMPHGKNAAVPDPAVSEHHISVQSGTTVSFMDTSSKHELHLQVDDKNLITIVVNSGQGTITLTGSKAIILKAPDIQLKADKELSIDATTVTISGKTKVAIESKADVAIEGLNVNVTAKVGAKVAGTATAEISASGITTVKGSMVMIN